MQTNRKKKKRNEKQNKNKQILKMKKYDAYVQEK